MPPFLLIFLVGFCSTLTVAGAEVPPVKGSTQTSSSEVPTPVETQTSESVSEAVNGGDSDRWVAHKPFVPETFDYYFELGAMWEERNMYWMGAGFGRHIGHCVFSESETCQQYWDVFGGVSGRDGLTSLLFLMGPRWQFVSFPKHYSPALRAFAGVMNIRDDLRDKEVFAYGVGYGWTMAVHDRVNMRLEGRVGHADEIWYQSVVSVHIKMDRWVDYFGAQLKKIGIDAVETTGGVLRKTGDAISDVFGGQKEK